MKKNSQPLVIDGSDELRQVVANIVLFHHMANNSASQAVLFAAKCGAELNRAKEICEHGQFGKWLANNIKEISNRTIYKYMDLAEMLEKKMIKFAPDANLQSFDLLALPDPRDIKSFSKCGVSEMVQKVTDGKSLSRLYEEFGIIKPRRMKKSLEEDEKIAKSKLAVKGKVSENKISKAATANRLTDEILAQATPDTIEWIIKEGTEEDINRLCKGLISCIQLFGFNVVSMPELQTK
jgi:hypothetical protein